MKRFFIIITLIVTVFTLFACNANDGNTSFTNDDVDEEVEYNDPSRVVIASVTDAEGNKHDILLSQLDEYMGDYIANFDSDFYLNNTTQQINDYYDSVVENFIRDEVKGLMAKDKGYFDTLTEEQTAEVKAQVEGEMNTLRENCLYDAVYEFAYEKVSVNNPDGGELSWDEAALDYVAAYDSGTSEDKDEIEALCEKMIEDFIMQTGKDEEYYTEYFTMKIAVENMNADITKNISVTENEIKQRYDNNIEADKKYYSETPDQFETDYIAGNAYYCPKGYRRVKQILLAIDDEYIEKISALEEEGKTEEAESLRKEAFEKIDEKGKKVLELCRADNADFDSIMKEYTDDLNIEFFPNGYVVGANSSSYDEDFKAAVWNIKNVGDVTGLIKTSLGYYIIKLVEEIKEGAVKYEDVRDQLEMTIMEEKYVEAFELAYDEYIAENIKVDIFKEAYHVNDSDETE